VVDPGGSRKLEAILVADVAGYSRLMQQDDEATVAMLEAYRTVFREQIEAHRGRVVDMAGDSVLAVFESATGAVLAAFEIQAVLAQRNQALSEERRMRFRIGVNLGEVIERPDGTVYGDGVNVAARLESIAEPGGVMVSGTVFDQVKNRVQLNFHFIGEHKVKNIAEMVPAYRVTSNGKPAKSSDARRVQIKDLRRFIGLASSIVVLAVVAVVTWHWTQGPSRVGSRRDQVIAVLPFTNMSGDPRQDYFSDGLTEDIINSLAQVHDLKVIARNSTFRYKGQAVEVRAVGKELGAKYVLEGSVRRASDTLRVTAQLIETDTGSHLWSKTYDRALTAKNVFGIQDDMAAAIATTLGGAFGVLHQVRFTAAQRTPPIELSSYDFVLLSVQLQRTLSLTAHRTARDCLESAVKADPEYAEAWGALANVYLNEYRYGYDPRPASLDRSLTAAERAVRLDPEAPYLHANLALVHFFRGERDAFRAEIDRALALGPKDSYILAIAGLYLCYFGEWGKGLALIERAKESDPYFPGWYYNGAFHNHYRKGEYEAALEAAQKGNMPDFVQSQSQIAAAYGELGRREEAQPYVKRILELDPNFEATAREHWWMRFRYQPAYLEQLIDGLRKAGLKIPPKGS
jgi:adenylate cyclase